MPAELHPYFSYRFELDFFLQILHDISLYHHLSIEGGSTMRKVLFIAVFWSALSTGCQTMAETASFENLSTLQQIEKTDDNDTLNEVDEIRIYVKSRKIRAIRRTPTGRIVSRDFIAATAAPRNTKDIPYGIVGSVYKVTVNPIYRPTEDHIKKEQAKGKKVLRVVPPNDPENPLGKMKLYFAFPQPIDPKLSFGAHGTNKPSSIGKRVSEGCVRLSDEDIEEIARLLLEQNGLDSKGIFEQASLDTKTSYEYILKKRPQVIFVDEGKKQPAKKK